MNLLFLTHRVPYPPDKGERYRAWQQIRFLARRHRVHLLSLADAEPGAGVSQALREGCASAHVVVTGRGAGRLRALSGLVRSRPLTLSYFDSAEARRLAARIVETENIDAAIACSSSMSLYGLGLGVPAVLDLVDVDSAKWRDYGERGPWARRWLYRLEATRLSRFEAEVVPRYDAVAVTTGREAEELERVVGSPVETIVLPSRVEAEETTPWDAPAAVRGADADGRIVFTGQMDYFPNVDGMTWFARRVFPEIRRRYQRAQLTIVGRSPVGAVRRLAGLPRVEVTGEVPEVDPYLQRASLFVAPLRVARGIQTKVLQAMAVGLPSVVSPPVADGLASCDLELGDHVRVAEGVDGFADAVTESLADPERLRRAGEAAQAEVRRRFGDDRPLPRLEEALRRITRPAAGER